MKPPFRPEPACFLTAGVRWNDMNWLRFAAGLSVVVIALSVLGALVSLVTGTFASPRVAAAAVVLGVVAVSVAGLSAVASGGGERTPYW